MKFKPFFLIMCLLLGACNSLQTGTPTSPATIESGKSSVSGRVLSSTTSLPLASVSVRLAQVYRQSDDGAFLLDGARSPGALTDEVGHFEIVNIAAAEYVIVVGDIYGEHRIVAEPSGQAKVWITNPDQELDVGDLAVDLP
jgi:hypothetical protein